MSLSIIIPTYGRNNVLCDTIRALIALETRADDILVVDQTLEHESATAERLAAWEAEGSIRWIHQEPPGTVGAMNRGVLETRGDDEPPCADLSACRTQRQVPHAVGVK